MDQMPPKPNLELPPPSENLAPNLESQEEQLTSAPEQKEQLAPGERLMRANDAVSQATAAAAQGPAMAQPAADDMAVVNNVIPSPVIADDVDVIEKEWVQKAKSIVERTKDDPGQQSDELANLKQEYKTNRFGARTKLTDQQVV